MCFSYSTLNFYADSVRSCNKECSVTNRGEGILIEANHKKHITSYRSREKSTAAWKLCLP